MRYTKDVIQKTSEHIFQEIENGKSLREVLRGKNMPSSQTFYKWLNDIEELAKRYARACELRAEILFDEIIEISDHSEEDHTPFTGANVVQRDKLRIDARKWVLSKMNPKKYGEKIDLTSDNKPIQQNISILNIDPLAIDETSDDSTSED